MDGTLQLSDSEGDGESVAESVSDPSTNGSIAKSLGLMGGCTTRLSRLRQGVPLMIGVAMVAETGEDELWSYYAVEDIEVIVLCMRSWGRGDWGVGPGDPGRAFLAC